MRKIFCIILAILLTFIFSACKNENDVRGDIVTGDPVPSSTAASTTAPAQKEVETGKLSGNRYVNSFLGVSCELGADWDVKSEDEIRQNNEATMEMLGDDYAEAIKNAATFTDMMATHTNQTDTVNVTFEKLSGVNLVLSEAQYAEISQKSLKEAFESLGMTNIALQIENGLFAGEEHSIISFSAEYAGVPVYEKIAVVKCENYMVCIVACTWQTDTCQDILDTFQPIG